MSAMLTLDNVSLSFGGLTIINDLNIQVNRGSRCALIGPNGAGKTTIFNLLSGVYLPSSGNIQLNGIDLAKVALDKRVHLGIGRTFQNLRLMKHLTVLENVMLGQHRLVSWTGRMFIPLTSKRNQELRREAETIVRSLGLGQDIDRLAEGLPYGVQKRVEIARALATRPSLLLLDEPAAGLNSSERVELSSILGASLPNDMTVLIVEHDVRFVSSLCDKVVALNFGQKIAEGSADTVCRDSAVIEAYLGKDGDDTQQADASHAA